jgi:peptidyl-prolyl cis-trans isomerase SurA
LNVAVKSKIVVTKEDARAYFEGHLEEFRGEKKVHLWNIMTTTPKFAFQAEIEAARGHMEQVLARLEAGESFEQIARELTSKKGPLVSNDIGIFRLGVLSPEIQDAVGGLKEGQHTGLLDTENGYQIFYVHKIVAGPGKQFAEVMPEIREKLFNEQVDRRFEEWLSDLREKSHIQIIR